MPKQPSEQPSVNPPEISSLCSLGLLPHVMTGQLRHYVGEHFAKRRNNELPELHDILWRAGNVGNILIESITRWRPAQLGKRPAVIIKRNDWQAQRVCIDDRAGITPQGDPVFLNIMTGSHTLFCISNEGAEAEILAAEVMNELQGFGERIRADLRLLRFVPVGLGELFELEEAKENFAVPVTVTYASKNVWTVHEQAPRLRSIDVNISDIMP